MVLSALEAFRVCSFVIKAGFDDGVLRFQCSFRCAPLLNMTKLGMLAEHLGMGFGQWVVWIAVFLILWMCELRAANSED